LRPGFVVSGGFLILNMKEGNKMNLEGKTVLIVGAGRGIGRAAADLFSNAEANVVISSRNEAELMELEYKLNSHGNPNVLSVEADAAVAADMISTRSSTPTCGRLLMFCRPCCPSWRNKNSGASSPYPAFSARRR
jgi:glutamyl-tRNA reductase